MAHTYIRPIVLNISGYQLPIRWGKKSAYYINSLIAQPEAFGIASQEVEHVLLHLNPPSLRQIFRHYEFAPLFYI